ncbi:PulJ/GspJ family protein [Winogradskyella forsetii]|uniref:PulJ/GspJ family protein n=1 Tax=Winogradskyella forsetii TaxID=2686077 RepID=UPI0015BF7FF3|nr:prepilin-type N-terminal cleavage/methylation domain-containing protein [Winogradskyella forsetii]
MKLQNKNFKAFTILEMVISLAIMSIIIAMVYVIFTMLSKQLYQYSDQTELVNNYNQLHTVLTRDIHNSNKIDYTDSVLTLMVNNDSLTYTYKSNRLTRSYLGGKDTFLITIKAFQMIESQSVFNNEIKHLEVTYTMFDQDIVAVYFKDVGVSNQVNQMFFSYGN